VTIKNKIYQHSFLVLASLFFYAYFNVSYLYIIIASIIVNYILAKVLAFCRETSREKYMRALLALGILFNLGLLGYFKYYDFFVENINIAFKTDFVLRHILLPLGISFFTFQQFSFLLSIYKGAERLEDFISYCLFVSFFPQLVAGPVVLYSEMMPQFTDDARRYLNYDNLAKGLYMFAIGLFKKIVIADTVALFVNNGFTLNNIGLSAAWATALSYTMQIYFDFSGYSDMAIGLATMFNINIPVNFMSPYKSESITEFWRRWHITLGRALSMYVYIPLGGNRKGLARNCINLFITFFASGLWHGAAWTFVLWGTLHGIVIIFERLFKNLLDRIPKALKIASTFLIVNIFWVLFRATIFENAINLYKGMFNIKNINVSQIGILAQDGLIGFPNIMDMAYVSVLIIALTAVVLFTKNSLDKMKEFSPNTKKLIFTVLSLCISIVHLSRESIFIYFNF